MVPAGSLITFDVTGTTNLYLATSPVLVRGDVVDALSPFVDVNNVTVIAPTWTSDMLNGFAVNTDYTATVQITTRVDYSDISDLASIVAHAFYTAVNALPTVTAEQSGQPAQQPAIGSSGPTFTSGLGSVLSGLQGTATLLIVAIVAIVYVIATGPNVGRVARAVGR